MTSTQSGRKADERRFLIALAISLSLHAAALWKFGMPQPGLSTAHSGPLHVTLAAPPARNVAHVEPQETAVPDGMPAPRDTRIAANDPARVDAPVAAKIESEPKPVAPSPSIPSNAAVTEAPTQVVGLPRTGQAGVARHVEIEFEIRMGEDRRLVGKGRHVYLSRADQFYGLSVKQIGASPVSDGEEPWELSISGQVDRQGLSPAIYQVKGNLPKGLVALKEAAVDSSTPSVKKRDGRMPEGLLDRQSLLYQFMLAPPSANGGGFWLTDGVASALYTYRIAGYESIAIPALGDVQTMKLILSTAGSREIIELWVIPDNRYLPAKIRHTDPFGVISEQVVVSLDAR